MLILHSGRASRHQFLLVEQKGGTLDCGQQRVPTRNKMTAAGLLQKPDLREPMERSLKIVADRMQIGVTRVQYRNKGIVIVARSPRSFKGFMAELTGSTHVAELKNE